jgi:ATP-dependent 26S proteasome regulatory subunit
VVSIELTKLQVMAVVGVLQDDVDPLVSVMKVEKAPLESYGDVGGLEKQIQEIKVRYTATCLSQGVSLTC